MFSIILCTYNRDKYIYNVLKSIAENLHYYLKFYRKICIAISNFSIFAN